MHTVEVSYSPAILRAGVKQFWWRFAGRDALLGLGGMAAAIACWLVLGFEHWLVLMLLGVSAFLFAVSIAVYFVYRARSLDRLRLMGSPSATWRFSEEELSTESDRGSSRMKWAAVQKVWRFPEVWIVFFSRYDYSILPASGLSPEVQAFIALRVQANGGTVV